MSGNAKGWTEWSEHVLAELKRLNECYEGLRKDVTKIKVETGQLKIRAGLTGLVGGLIPVLGFVAMQLFKG